MSLGRSLGIGAAGSLGIMAFGIPILWPLGILTAAIAHAMTQGNKRTNRERGRDMDSTREDEYPRDTHDNRRQWAWEPPAEPPEQISWEERLGRPELGGHARRRMRENLPRRNTDFLQGLGRIGDPMEELRQQAREQEDDREESILNRQLDQPSIRNEAYFRRQGRG